MKPNPAVLIIDSDQANRRLLHNLLEAHRYRIHEAETGQAGIKEAARCSPDVIILELSLDDMDGTFVVQRLREWNHAPILILSDRDAASDKVLALDSGANDYVTKPFNSAELLARLRVLQRSHPAEPDGPIFVHGQLRVDVSARTVTLGGNAVDLTPTEQVIFYTLLRHAGKVVSRRHLFRCVWGMDCESKLHDLHVYIANLRRKLRDSSDQILIQTQGSDGYCLLIPSAQTTTDFDAAEPAIAAC